METIEEQARSECRGSPNSSDEAVVQGSPDHTEIVQTGDRICLVGNLMDDCEMLRVAHSFNMHVVNSENGESVLEDDEYWNTRYIIKEFNGREYDRINAAKKCILGPPALKWVSHRNLKLPYTSRAVYSFAMRGVVACFTGLRNKEELTTMVMMIHSMGGAIRKDMNSRITHLIANHSTGDKYQYAKTFRLPVLRTDWVAAAWAKREDPTFSAVDESFASQYRLHIFAGQRICLSGFSDDEYQEMRAIMLANGGTPVELDDPTCTHVVVYSAAAKKEPANPQSIIVTAEWFWYTIQNGYADTSDFLMGDKIVEAHQQMTPNTDRRESLPISFNNKRKRKRFSQRLQLEGTPLSTGKRRSSVSDAGLLSVSSSFFDFTSSPDKLENTSHMSTDHKSSKSDQTPGKKASMRHNHFMDFYSTESNYVGILDTIVQLFKNPLEKMLDEGDPLLNKAEIHAIFSNFQPIYDVHLQMLQALREIHHNWTDTCLIGDIILEHQADLTRAYPKYVNCFEQMQETLQHCDSAYPRFHAFLKINQTKPECGRQTLQDLMIRPVQRLPSISLLLTDILKYTSKSNPDHARLTEALKSLKEVTTYINEDKRKTDARVAMFDVFNGIDGCPPELISSNRDFVAKIDIIEMTDMMSGRGDSLVLYLFSDYIEFCKKRTRVFNTAKSPSTGKVCKHLQLMSLNSILHVVDITDGARAFALVTKDCTYAYSIVDDDATKAHYVSLLCKQIAQNACVTDIDNFHLSRTSLELGVDISDIHMSTLSKAFKLATRTRLKVGRAFSFSKTPSKLKRTTSTMMTPPFGSNNTVIMTPASQLAQMQLASCNNVNETDDEQNTRNSSTDSDSQIVPLKAPLSEQPKRKNKSATIGRI